MIRLGLLGGTGRMGQEVLARLVALNRSDIQIVARPGSAEPLDSLFAADVVIDFSLPLAVERFLDESVSREMENPPALVVGSTGWSEAQLKKLESYARQAPVLKASNFSMGIHVLKQALVAIAPNLAKLGYEPVLTEAHHRHKKDSPSGTAQTLLETLNHASQGIFSSVQTHAIRAGDIVGRHTITFYKKGEEISVTHEAKDRGIFADGAIRSALWIAEHRRKKIPLSGILTPDDVLKDDLFHP